MNTLNSQGFYQKASVDSERTEEQLNMIFTARLLQEKCQEQNMDLYMTYVDFTKAFDTVNPECFGKLWRSLAVQLSS